MKIDRSIKQLTQVGESLEMIYSRFDGSAASLEIRGFGSGEVTVAEDSITPPYKFLQKLLAEEPSA